MKLSKKILKTFSVIAMLAASMVVVACAAEDDDDEEGAITGSNNDYAIAFTNNSDCSETTIVSLSNSSLIFISLTIVSDLSSI